MGCGGLKRFCSELISTLKSTTTSESREPGRERWQAIVPSQWMWRESNPRGLAVFKTSPPPGTPLICSPKLNGLRWGITPRAFIAPAERIIAYSPFRKSGSSRNSFLERHRSSSAHGSVRRTGSFRWTPRRSAHRTMP